MHKKIKNKVLYKCLEFRSDIYSIKYYKIIFKNNFLNWVSKIIDK